VEQITCGAIESGFVTNPDATFKINGADLQSVTTYDL
jgi:hypothetical protein